MTLPSPVDLEWRVPLPFWARRSKLIIVGGLVTVFAVTGIVTRSRISVILALGVLAVFALPSRGGRGAATDGPAQPAARPFAGPGPDLSFRLRLAADDGLTLYSATPEPAHVAWSDVTKVEHSAQGLTITTRSGRKDALVVPSSALTPDTLAAARAVVDASAPGRWTEAPPS